MFHGIYINVLSYCRACIYRSITLITFTSSNITKYSIMLFTKSSTAMLSLFTLLVAAAPAPESLSVRARKLSPLLMQTYSRVATNIQFSSLQRNDHPRREGAILHRCLRRHPNLYRHQILPWNLRHRKSKLNHQRQCCRARRQAHHSRPSLHRRQHLLPHQDRRSNRNLHPRWPRFLRRRLR